LALRRAGFTKPGESPRLLVRSYRTFSPLPLTRRTNAADVTSLRRVRGGLFSVALSLVSRPVGVTHRPVLWRPDFPLVRLLRAEPAIARSSPHAACTIIRRRAA